MQTAHHNMTRPTPTHTEQDEATLRTYVRALNARAAARASMSEVAKTLRLTDAYFALEDRPSTTRSSEENAFLAGMRLWLLQRSTGLQSLTTQAQRALELSPDLPPDLSLVDAEAHRAAGAKADECAEEWRAQLHRIDTARSATLRKPSRKQPFDEGVPPRKRFAAMRAPFSPFPNENTAS